jgi:hypothetical protein
LQVFFTFAAAIFLYLLTLKLIQNKTTAVILTLSFLISTYTFRTIINDYHPESMYMMMFFAFLYFAESNRFFISSLFMCLAVSMKEEAAIYMAMACIFIVIRTKDKRYLLLSIFSLIYAFIIIKLVMPAFNPDAGGWIESMAANISTFRGNYLNSNFFIQFFIFLLGAIFLPLFCLDSFLLIFLPPIIIQCAHYSYGLPVLFDIQYASFVTPALFAGVLYFLNKIYINKTPAAKYINLFGFIILSIQIQIHLSFMAAFSFEFIITMYLAVFVLLFIAFAVNKINFKTNFILLAFLILVVSYGGYVNAYSKERLNNISEEQKSSINKAIKYIPEDENTVLIANANIITHLCCRKFVWALEIGNTTYVLLPIIKEKLNEFYVLTYLYDFTYQRENINSGARNQEILDLAIKLGYKYTFLYADNITGVIKFNK